MSSKGIAGGLIIGGIALLAGQTAQNVAKQDGLLHTGIGVLAGGVAAIIAMRVLK